LTPPGRVKRPARGLRPASSHPGIAEMPREYPSAATKIPWACSCRTGRPPQPRRIDHSRTLCCSPTTCHTHEPAGLEMPPSASCPNVPAPASYRPVAIASRALPRSLQQAARSQELPWVWPLSSHTGPAQVRNFGLSQLFVPDLLMRATAPSTACSGLRQLVMRHGWCWPRRAPGSLIGVADRRRVPRYWNRRNRLASAERSGGRHDLWLRSHRPEGIRSLFAEMQAPPGGAAPA
jgi:hypothetical protein